MFPSDITMYFIYTFLFAVFPALLLNIYLITEEDPYQAKKDDGGKIVANLIKTNTLSTNIIEKKVTNFVQTYNKNCKYNNRISKHTNNCVFTDSKKYNEVNDDYHYKILLNTPNNTIYFQFKHKYIGGAYIRDLSSSLIDTEQSANEKFYPHSSFFNIIYVAKLLYNYRTIPKIDTAKIEQYTNCKLPSVVCCKRLYNPPTLLKLVESSSEIRRYVNTYTLDRADNKHSSRTIILFNALKTLQKALALNRPIVRYLPIAFNHVKGINNNIGIMFIDLREEDTINTFNKRF